MNAQQRLEVAGKIIQKIHEVRDEKKAISEDIKTIEMEMETAIIDQDQAIDLVKLLSKRKKREGARSEAGRELTVCNQSLEQIILGKGEWDADQIDFEDLESNLEKIAAEEKAKEAPVEKTA